jgi:glycosyltransferase involved in cell wall biosynthesis
MRIGIYIEHGVGDGVGGAEIAMAFLAGAWSHSHDVHLIHHRPPLTRDRLAVFTGDGLSAVTIRCLPRDAPPGDVRNLVRRFRSAHEWHRNLSDTYDVFVNCTHWLPCFNHAAVGILFVLFPMYVRPEHTVEMERLPRWKQLRHAAYFGAEWRRRLQTYEHRTTISEFARQWTARRWGIDCDVVHPPANVGFDRVAKEPLVLSVGRFSTLAHTKKQMEMVTAFRELEREGAGWSYACVGGLNNRKENQDYFERVTEAARDSGVRVAANVAHTEVRSLYERARIFWHATGFNDSTDSRPELAEHFGIATVEAMAAGCVPVVVNKGGQPEIVQHGTSGFVWNTLDELKGFTWMLMNDPELCARMSRAARQRAQRFSQAAFLREMSRRAGIATPHAAALPVSA